MAEEGRPKGEAGSWPQVNYSSHHLKNKNLGSSVYSNEALGSALMAMMLDRVYGRLRGDGVARERGA